MCMKISQESNNDFIFDKNMFIKDTNPVVNVTDISFDLGNKLVVSLMIEDEEDQFIGTVIFSCDEEDNPLVKTFPMLFMHAEWRKIDKIEHHENWTCITTIPPSFEFDMSWVICPTPSFTPEDPVKFLLTENEDETFFEFENHYDYQFDIQIAMKKSITNMLSVMANGYGSFDFLFGDMFENWRVNAFVNYLKMNYAALGQVSVLN